MHPKWLKELTAFFDERSEAVAAANLHRQTLSYVSGRDARLWDESLYRDLIKSIIEQLDMGVEHTILEVGCAAGFLAQGLSSCVASYIGVDLSKHALRVAQRLALPQCVFQYADGLRLPFGDGSFDRVLSYDVFTNYPSMEHVCSVVSEMARVTRPSGKLLVGSLADREKESEFTNLVSATNIRLEKDHGPRYDLPKRKQPLHKQLLTLLRSRGSPPEPRIVCYSFRKEDFVTLGERLNLQTLLCDIHSSNPYYGYRFNVLYTKP